MDFLNYSMMVINDKMHFPEVFDDGHQWQMHFPKVFDDGHQWLNALS